MVALPRYTIPLLWFRTSIEVFRSPDLAPVKARVWLWAELAGRRESLLDLDLLPVSKRGTSSHTCCVVELGNMGGEGRSPQDLKLI